MWEILEHMKEEDSLILGGNRSYGYGKCRILQIERTDRLPYEAKALREDAKDKVYMLLLSNTAMVSEAGENVGIDRNILAQKLGLSGLEIQFCSTSVIDVRGYNRTWRAMVPSVKMYEPGSVFKLVFSGERASQERLRAVMDTGLGIRINEGCGRVLFLDNYEALSRKKNISISREIKKTGSSSLNESDRATLLIAAKGYYMKLVDRAVSMYISDNRNDIGRFGLSGAQLGTIESILLSDLYGGEKGFDRLLAYFEAAKEKDDRSRIQRAQQKREKIAMYVEELVGEGLPLLLGTPESVMGMRYDEILTPGEIMRIKQNLMIRQIRFLNRGGKNDD